MGIVSIAALVAVSAMSAGCGDGEPTPDGGADPDGGPAADAVPSPDANPYAGTCIDEVFKCFDWMLPCTDMPSGTKLAEVFANGAVYTYDLGDQTGVAVNSAGASCFTAHIDPTDPTVTIIDAAQGTFKVQGSSTTDQQTITCPDGTQFMVPGTMPPFAEATESCQG
jgi:hypothetical protein